MNHHLTLTATTAIIAAMLSAPVPVHAETRDVCALDPSFLPHTADAAQAWFDHCRERRSLPHTADAAQAWFDSSVAVAPPTKDGAGQTAHQATRLTAG